MLFTLLLAQKRALTIYIGAGLATFSSIAGRSFNQLQFFGNINFSNSALRVEILNKLNNYHTNLSYYHSNLC